MVPVLNLQTARTQPPNPNLKPQGYEDAATHLVVGGDRRTLKVLLAVAGGAHLLRPDWLTASLEAVSGA